MNWIAYDTPQTVEDAFGTYAETICSGAADAATVMPGERRFVVAEDEWNADFTVRTIRKLAAVTAS